MHNLKPNTQYVIIDLQVAVTKESFESGEYADEINFMFDNVVGRTDIVGDWQFKEIQNRPEHTTGDNIQEGETFV
ncbi:MAG: hypothetical protein KGI50_06830 [Patescibacteria group bacterium]|nr:hypothetical protein [Patescibacteria group bacterium]MDE2439290.1 hypothetical protein [Patescibacteria group bacterium]